MGWETLPSPWASLQAEHLALAPKRSSLIFYSLSFLQFPLLGQVYIGFHVGGIEGTGHGEIGRPGKSGECLDNQPFWRSGVCGFTLNANVIFRFPAMTAVAKMSIVFEFLSFAFHDVLQFVPLTRILFRLPERQFPQPMAWAPLHKPRLRSVVRRRRAATATAPVRVPGFRCQTERAVYRAAFLIRAGQAAALFSRRRQPWWMQMVAVPVSCQMATASPILTSRT